MYRITTVAAPQSSHFRSAVGRHSFRRRLPSGAELPYVGAMAQILSTISAQFLAGHLYNICFGDNLTDCLAFARDGSLDINQSGNSTIPFSITQSNSSASAAFICNTQNGQNSCLTVNPFNNSAGIQHVSLEPLAQTNSSQQQQLWTLSLDSSDADDPDTGFWTLYSSINGTTKQLYWDTDADKGVTVAAKSTDTWQIIDTATEKNSTSSTTASSGAATSTTVSQSITVNTGLSTAAVAGIAVGVVLAVVLLIGAIVAWCLLRKRRQRKQSPEQFPIPKSPDTEQSLSTPSPTATTGTEIQSSEVYEKPVYPDTGRFEKPTQPDHLRTELPTAINQHPPAELPGYTSPLVSPMSPQGRYELPSPDTPVGVVSPVAQPGYHHTV